MQKTFCYETIQFTYQLLPESRKTLAATVYPDQSIVVKAPTEATVSDVDLFLKRKWRWILKQKRYFGQFRPWPEREYVSGESLKYLGRTYKLLIRESTAEPKVRLQYGKLIVYTSEPKDRHKVKEMVEAWYLMRAWVVFTEQLELCFYQFGRGEMPKLSIRKMKKRWGSYLKKENRILLNRNLIQASKPQIRYVIFHELCHTLHPRHDKAFYALLEKLLPTWKEVKAELELKLLSS